MDPVTPPGQPGAPPAPPAQPGAPPPQPSGDDAPPGTKGPGNNYLVPHQTWAKMKAKQRDKGKRDAVDEYEKIAKEAGFASFKDAIAFLGESKKGRQPGSKPNGNGNGNGNGARPNGQPSGSGKFGKQYEAEKAQWLRERGDLTKKLNKTSRDYRELEQNYQAAQAEWELQKLAISKGIKDPDYAVRLLTRHLESAGLTDPEKIKEAKFDDGVFFDKLRETHPYLYGEVVRPVTTGNGPNGQPKPPGSPAPPTNPSATFDARKATPNEFRAELQKRGLSLDA